MNIVKEFFHYWFNFFIPEATNVEASATVLLFFISLLGVYVARKELKKNNIIKRNELINKIYDHFLEDSSYEFYDRIRDKEDIVLNEDNKKLLNKALSMFDEINYLRTQNLLDDEAWEYVACEIQNFAANETVWKYMLNYVKMYKEKRFPKDIIPFTGFPDLLKYMPRKFKVEKGHRDYPKSKDEYEKYLKECYSPKLKFCEKICELFTKNLNICKMF